MTRLLLDEMLPLRAAEILREEHGHRAAHVCEFGLDATADADIATFARANDWAVVTENVVDFARESDLVLVFVLKRSLPAGGAQAGGRSPSCSTAGSGSIPTPTSALTGRGDRRVPRTCRATLTDGCLLG